MKGILLPRNYLKFPLLKIIVRKIASKSLITSKNLHFLRTDHRNLVHENFFRDIGGIIYIKNLFNLIRVINRTNCWAIWTRVDVDMDHFSKRPSFQSNCWRIFFCMKIWAKMTFFKKLNWCLNAWFFFK